MDTEDRIKLYGMSHSLVERELDKVEQEHYLDLQRSEKYDKDEEYYPQFDFVLRTEAAQMGKHYEVFYCLEKNIRKLISETLESAHGENWWETFCNRRNGCIHNSICFNLVIYKYADNRLDSCNNQRA